MKIRSPIVTLIIGVLIAVVTVVLSVRANDAATNPGPSTSDPYSLTGGMAR
jgi:hypothetical protein